MGSCRGRILAIAWLFSGQASAFPKILRGEHDKTGLLEHGIVRAFHPDSNYPTAVSAPIRGALNQGKTDRVPRGFYWFVHS